MLTRKELLAGAAAAGVVAGCGKSSAPKKTAAGPAGEWEAVRAQFALDPKRRHFAQFYLASPARPVREAIARHRAGLDASTFEYMADHERDLDFAVEEAAAGHLGVDGEEIAFTESTTQGIGLLYAGLVEPGDEALTTEHDFFATYDALSFAGARVRKVRLYRDPAKADAEEIVEAIVKGVTPRTRVVAVTWVHSSTGVKLPIAAIAEALRGRALLCVDAVHGFGAEPADLEALGCDAFVSGCHKWLGGPRGTGLAWAREAAWKRVQPTIPSFSGPTPGGRHTPGGFHAFEHRWALAEAFAFQAEIGQKKIAARFHALAGRLKAGLGEIDGVRLITPTDEALSAGLVCCEIRSRTPESAVEALRAEHAVIASVTPYAQRYLRFGTGLGVLEADVDAAVEAVRAIA